MTKRKWILAIILEIICIPATLYCYSSENTYALAGCIFFGILAIVIPIAILQYYFEQIGIKIKNWFNQK